MVKKGIRSVKGLSNIWRSAETQMRTWPDLDVQRMNFVLFPFHLFLSGDCIYPFPTQKVNVFVRDCQSELKIYFPAQWSDPILRRYGRAHTISRHMNPHMKPPLMNNKQGSVYDYLWSLKIIHFYLISSLSFFKKPATGPDNYRDRLLLFISAVVNHWPKKEKKDIRAQLVHGRKEKASTQW